jgi:hypothetical protein
MCTPEYTRVHQLRSKFFPTREPEAVQDGICYLKVIIDSYYCNARPATAKVKSNSQDYTCTCERQQEEMFPSCNEEFHLWLQRPMIIKGTNDSESYTLTL